MSQYKPYPAYKDSGVEWLGRVPEHWQQLPLKRLVRSIEQGWSPECESWPATSDEWGVLKVGCVNGGSFRPEENKALPVSLEPRPELSVVKGDVLVSRANTRELVGSCVFVPQDYPNLLLCDKIYRIRAGELVTPAFLAALITVHGRRSVEIEATGASSSMLNISQSVILDLPVALPASAEQNQIMAATSRETARIDALIEKKTRFIELLREKRQALITYAVTKGLDPNVKMKDSSIEWLGKVPEHWSICNVQHVIEKIEQGWSPDCLNTPAVDGQWGIVKSGCVNGGIFNPQENKALPVHLSPVPEYEIKIGDILMSRASGSPELIGSIALVKEATERLMLSDKIFRLQCSKKMVPAFFVMVMGARLVRAQVEQSISGADGLANNLPQSRIKKFVIPCPPIREQLEISSFVDAQASRLHELGERTKRSIALLKERRSALITAAVTGQIDLREAV